MSKYDFKGAKLNNNDGTMAIGEHQSINNVVSNGIEEASKKFRDELLKADIPEDKKEEIQGAVEAAENEAESEKPNKIVLSALLDSIKKTIGVVSATPALITAYEKWKAFFNL